ncbi:hypothetical protein VCO01S_38140 [Vibrio comitans NBRC 102076]|uniref:Uncharacterized protein n=1 Tax=Vibrio comitans NBRC 102076 TaxID=1219078 RepID=A0A4Y3ISS6_9VIBR|nr:hypothetical protein VCO01S_38140 [Vibrio comitans NBRC 102076]
MRLALYSFSTLPMYLPFYAELKVQHAFDGTYLVLLMDICSEYSRGDDIASLARHL